MHCFAPYLTIVVEASHRALLQQPQILVIQQWARLHKGGWEGAREIWRRKGEGTGVVKVLLG